MLRTRRAFLQSSAAFSLGFTGLQRLLAEGISPSDSSQLPGSTPDPAGLLDLPPGFEYRVISRCGDLMNDGLLVPDKPDGMATFPGPNGTTLIVRNHEIDPSLPGPFGEKSELLFRTNRNYMYDLGEAGRPCNGGTTTVVYDTNKQMVVRQFLSLGGTIRNCSGGPTPWGSWITCEEATDRVGENIFEENRTYCQHDHGYNFDVPATANVKLHKAEPLKAMGRFRHEAVAVHPSSGIVFQTEDVDDGLIYRFLPSRPGELIAGGRLQALVVAGRPSADLRNWTDVQDAKAGERVTIGERLPVRWIDLDEVESPNDDLRYRGFERGAARFARNEGMWFAGGSIYFASTSGGPAKIGQLWKYNPSPNEGRVNETDEPATLELFVESPDSTLVANADNLTAAPWGDLVVCEDRDGDDVRLVGVTPSGQLYTLANNRVHSEFSGATFSPDGSTLFVNLQHEGLTLAITGPWPKRA